MRLFGPDGEIPIQIDERDGSGIWAEKPNGVLDADDELVFLAAVPAASKTVFRLYFSTQPSASPQQPSPEFQWRRFTTAEFKQKGCDAQRGNGVVEEQQSHPVVEQARRWLEFRRHLI
jgi:hypothetical protein